MRRGAASGLSGLVGAQPARPDSYAPDFNAPAHISLGLWGAFLTYALCWRRYIVEFATSKADVEVFCAVRARAGRACVHQYSLALLGCSVQVRHTILGISTHALLVPAPGVFT
jgi:hypothetical protein